MKSFIHNFSGFINEESGYYPPGTENDPNAPWNQSDPDIYRENDWIDSKAARERVTVNLIAADYSEFALLKHKETGDLYLAYLAGEEIEEYMPKYQTSVGRDEDGDVDYDYEDAEMDDAAIIAMASDLVDKAGEGMAGWDNGDPLVKIDAELAEQLIDDFKSYAVRKPNNPYTKMVEVMTAKFSKNNEDAE